MKQADDMYGSGWIEYEGRSIYLLDLTRIGMGDFDYRLAILDRVHEEIKRANDVLILTDISHSAFTVSSNRLMTDLARKNKPYVLASAIVGASGVRKTVISSIAIITNRKLKTFDTREAALEWLVRQVP